MGKETKNLHSFTKQNRIYWDLLIFLAILYSAIEMPFTMVFQIKNPIFFYANFFIDFVFLVDLIINCNEAWKSPKGSLGREYFKTWFLVDLPAAIPAVILSFLSSRMLDFSYISLIKVIRIIRIAKLFQSWNKIGNTKPTRLSYQRILVFIIVTSILAHWVTLGWIFVGGVENKNGILSTYINSLYWTITTFTTIGYGDITPQNNYQKIFTMIVMVIGAGLYGYIIGNITSLLSNIDHAKMNFTERMEKVGRFLAYKKIPLELQEAVFKYYGYLWESHRGYDEDEIMQDLPYSLRMNVALYMNKSIIEKIPLFKNANENIIKEIVLQLKPVIFTPGDYIFRLGEEGQHMYFISNGSVEIVDEEKGIVFATLSEGSYFGEMALLFATKRSASAKALDFCDLYRLDRSQFMHIINRYPDFSAEIKQMAEKRKKENISKKKKK
jgi:voltage-gated potassium channel